jgi:PAS domain S-box-containing protein
VNPDVPSPPESEETSPEIPSNVTAGNVLADDITVAETLEDDRVQRAEIRTEHAETRAEEAKTRTEQAEVRTEQAETRTERAKTRTEEAETRSERAEARSEELIRQSELNYRRLFEAAKDGILILDADTGLISDVNPSLTTILDFSLAELVGTPIWELGPFKDIVSNKSKFDQLHEKGYVVYENLALETKAGRRIVVEFVGNVYQVIQCNVRDITDRNRTEGRFRRLVDSNAQGVFFWKARGEVTVVNEAFLKIVGYTREDLEVGRINWLAMTPQEFAPLDRNAFRELKETGSCALYEKEFIRKDGVRVPILIGGASFDDAEDEGVCFVIDLTERKKLEHQFLRAQRMESIGTLAGGVAHDLNNILAPIMMSIDVLKSMSSPEATSILETIEISAKRGADIVRQVLSFARGLEVERIEVQPRHLLQDVENIIKDTFPKDIRLEFSIPSELWTIYGDPTQIHQILLNLCVNARDAMPMGGILTLSVENCLLDEHYAAMNLQTKPGRYICINVIDSGIGMQPDLIDKIFEPFFTTKELNKGTGLGLSTVLAIVKSHNGAINVYSEPGKGTTFKVYLPAMNISNVTHHVEAEPVNLPRGNGETILVVDDEASIRTITSQTLQAFGYSVVTASDGTEALAAYVEHRAKIAVVVTDMSMPVLDGPATIRALKKLNPAVKIIGASGLNMNGTITNNTGTGVKYFLTKPYTAGTLLTTIRTILDESAAGA